VAFILHVVCDRGSVLLLLHCDTLCTSGFTDDVMFSYHAAPGVKSAIHDFLVLQSDAGWDASLR